MGNFAYLTSRGVVAVTGEDRVAFLQGLVSNDVAQAAPGRAVWAALLTPQGKWLADFFIFAAGDTLLLDCERAQAAMLVTRLARYRLRSKIAVTDVSGEWRVYAGWGEAADLPADAMAAPDPRLSAAGMRVLARTALPVTATAEAYDRHRLRLGLPDGSRDLESEKTVLLEAGFDELGGVSWTKGCFMGQELTARTKYRGLVKKRLVPVEAAFPLPAPGTPVMAKGTEIGVMRSAAGEVGLAQLRLDADWAALASGGVALHAHPPNWMTIEINHKSQQLGRTRESSKTPPPLEGGGPGGGGSRQSNAGASNTDRAEPY